VVAVRLSLLPVADACCAYALSRLPSSGQHHFVFWILSTRMMPPVAVAIPMFFIYKDANLLDTYTGLSLFMPS
jgi:multiple sugar transport system permease protein